MPKSDPNLSGFRYVFSEYFFRAGKLQPVEFAILDQWFKLLSSIPEFHLSKDLTGIS